MRMKIEFNKYAVAGCIPKSHMQNAPTDQTPCILENCQRCNREMWVSELKREWRSKNLARKIFCFICLAEESHRQGIETEIGNLEEFQ